jgi:hypothetical protein
MLPRLIEKKQLRFNGVAILSSGGRMDSDADDSKSNYDDSKSTTSIMSMARVAEICPCCKKELQARAMFNHLRKLHPDYLKSMYCVWEISKLDELIKTNAPMPIEWRVMDDFDEEIEKILWGCLACNNTYTTEQTALKHCNAKCKKDHNAELKRIKKEEQKEKEQAEKKFSKERLRWINRTPKQVYTCIQQEVDFYNKRWATVSSKVIQYMHNINSFYNETNDCDKYVFTPIRLPTFEDDKDNMLKEERRIDREITNYQTLYKDALRLFWGAHTIVSDGEYESLERNIRGNYPDIQY